jgi:hypothetical protein
MPTARARRAPTGSVSPRAARISAIRLTVARNQIASPAAAFGHNGFQPVFGVEAEHILAGAGPFGAFGGQCRVGLGEVADKMVPNRGQGIIPTQSLSA